MQCTANHQLSFYFVSNDGTWGRMRDITNLNLHFILLIGIILISLIIIG